MTNETTQSNPQVLQWHPQFVAFSVIEQSMPEKGVVLLGENAFYWLPESDFPGMTEIDGQQSCDHISAAIANNMTAITFFYQAGQLQQQGLLVDIHDTVFSQYQQHTPDQITPLLQRSRLEISALSAAPQTQLMALAQFLSDGLVTATKPAPLHILLVDDFLHPAIAGFMANLPHTLIIKVSGEQLWISPLYARSETAQPELDWLQLQKRLSHNQPLRHWIQHKLPGKTLTLPVNTLQSAKLNNTTQHSLLRLIHQQLSTTSKNLVLLNRTDQTLENHPVAALPPLKSNQRKAFIALEEHAIQFNTDGGSRTCMPMETLARLTPLVSPVTGVITQFKPMDTPATDLLSGEVKIYQTAYYKPVPPEKPFFTPSSAGNPPFIQVCMGKGVSPIQSQVSALSEAVERYCAMYADDQPDQITRPELLTARHISYAALYPLSSEQFATGNMFSKTPYNGEVICWTQAWSLSHHEPVYVPQSACFSNSPLQEEQFGRWHSNGCAAGNTIEEAILQGLFELIERDATAIWWYNKIARPAYDTQQIDRDNLNALHGALAPHHDYWLLDITTDLGIPVMAAVAKNRTTGGYILGFGCHLSAPLAAQRALTELCQLIPIRDQNAAPFNFDAMQSEAWLHPTEDAIAEEHISNASESQTVHSELTFLIQNLARQGFETLAFNYDRSYLPLEVAKVFVPGLCHIWPQLANNRMYRVPVKMGWRKKALNAGSINQQPLLI